MAEECHKNRVVFVGRVGLSQRSNSDFLTSRLTRRHGLSDRSHRLIELMNNVQLSTIQRQGDMHERTKKTNHNYFILHAISSTLFFLQKCGTFYLMGTPARDFFSLRVFLQLLSFSATVLRLEIASSQQLFVNCI